MIWDVQFHQVRKPSYLFRWRYFFSVVETIVVLYQIWQLQGTQTIKRFHFVSRGFASIHIESTITWGYDIFHFTFTFSKGVKELWDDYFIQTNFEDKVFLLWGYNLTSIILTHDFNVVSRMLHILVHSLVTFTSWIDLSPL